MSILRSNSNSLSLCDKDGTSENHSFGSLKTDHYHEFKPNQAMRISSIVNPDGSVTVRNLMIQEDGTWAVIQEDVHCDENENLHQTGCDQFIDGDIPPLEKANTFESSNSSSSEQNDKFKSMTNPSHPKSHTNNNEIHPPLTDHHEEKEIIDFMTGHHWFREKKGENSGNDNAKVERKLLPVVERSSSSARSEESSVFQDVAVSYNDKNKIDEILGKLENPKMQNRILPGIANGISYLDEDQEDTNSQMHSVTVYKNSRIDKIGIYVGVEKFKFGDRLVVSKITSDGKFVDSGIEVGDIVISINGVNMIEDPSPDRALSIVVGATCEVTIVTMTQKNVEMGELYTHECNMKISSDASVKQKFLLPIYGVNRPNSIEYETSKLVLNQRIGNNENGSDANIENGNREKKVYDGSMLSFTKSSEVSKPTSILMNESWKLSGAIVVNLKKKDNSDTTGIRMGVKEASNGCRVIFISDIIQSSLFAKTPLQIGDTILSINSICLQKNADVVDAYAALKSGNRVTIVAKKGEKSLNEFLARNRELVVENSTSIRDNEKIIDTSSSSETAGTVGTTKGSETTMDSMEHKIEFRNFPERSDCKDQAQGKVEPKKNKFSTYLTPKPDESKFDEESYGAPLYGYNSSSNAKFVKKFPSEDVGLEIRETILNWGKLLTVSKIRPNSSASTTLLKVGDVILAINGVDFRNNPDVENATSLIKFAWKEVNIEYQNLSSYFPAMLVDLCEVPIQEGKRLQNQAISHIKMNDNFFVTTKPSSSNNDENEIESHSIKSELKMITNREKSIKHSVKIRRQKVWITVTRGDQGKKVGMNLATLNNKLVVTKVSSSGLLRNAPIIPGDTILSINEVGFRFHPNAKKALLLMEDGSRRLTFEILKTGCDETSKKRNNGTKPCALGSFLCVTGRNERG